MDVGSKAGSSGLAYCVKVPQKLVHAQYLGSSTSVCRYLDSWGIRLLSTSDPTYTTLLTPIVFVVVWNLVLAQAVGYLRLKAPVRSCCRSWPFAAASCSSYGALHMTSRKAGAMFVYINPVCIYIYRVIYTYAYVYMCTYICIYTYLCTYIRLR